MMIANWPSKCNKRLIKIGKMFHGNSTRVALQVEANACKGDVDSRLKALMTEASGPWILSKYLVIK